METVVSAPAIELYFPRAESLPRYLIIVTYTPSLRTRPRGYPFEQPSQLPSSHFLSPAHRGSWSVVLLILRGGGSRHRGSICRNEKRQKSSSLGSRREIEKGGGGASRSGLSGWLSLSSVVPLLTLEFSSTCESGESLTGSLFIGRFSVVSLLLPSSPSAPLCSFFFFFFSQSLSLGISVGFIERFFFFFFLFLENVSVLTRSGSGS